MLEYNSPLWSPALKKYHFPRICPETIYQLQREFPAVASLGLMNLVSSGAVTDGVTPIFFFKKIWRPFLVITCHFYSDTPTYFLLKTGDLLLLITVTFINFTVSLGCHPLIDGGRPLLPEILGQNDRVGAKSQIFYLFSLVAFNIYLSVKTVSHRVVRHSLG